MEGDGDVVERGETGDAEAAAVGEGFDEGGFGGLEFVADFADEFLDEAFEGDDAGGGTEVVHDEGHVEFLAEEFFEGGFEGFGFGEAEDVALDEAEVERGAGGGVAEEVLDVDEAEAVVEVAVAEGLSLIHIFGAWVERDFGRSADGWRGDVRARADRDRGGAVQ